METIRKIVSGLRGKGSDGDSSHAHFASHTSGLTTLDDKRPLPEETGHSENGPGIGDGDAPPSETPKSRYVRKGELGTGGMGKVYLAHDLQLERDVAIKVIRNGDNSNGLTARLRREAKALAKISHPNVVQVHTDFIDGHGDLNVVMEYVKGVTLDDWMRTKGRRIGDVVNVFIAAADGLVAVHEANLAHRDFKPSNVLIDERNVVRVLDLGLARASDDPMPVSNRDADEGEPHDDRNTTQLTRDGAVLGTPRYMAPEQWQGLRADGRSDQFAFCVSLFEALYGSSPFGGHTSDEIKKRVLAGKFEFPSSRNVRGRVTRKLRALLRRGLEVDPEARFPSMAALRAELSRDTQNSKVRRAVAITTVSVATVSVFVTFYLYNKERWRIYQETCLQPARVAYYRGDLRVAKDILSNQTCIDSAPRAASVHASVRALEVMSHTLYGADEQLPLSTASKHGGTADAHLARALEALSLVRVNNPSANREELMQLLEGKLPAIRRQLDDARAEKQTEAVAPHAHLVVEALLTREPNPGLLAKINAAIAEVETKELEVPFFLHYARLNLEADHRRAIELIQQLLERRDARDEVVQLLEAELAFRSSLQLLETPEDHRLRAATTQLLIEAPMPSNLLFRAHLDLAYAAVQLPNHANSTQLDSVRNAAPKLWWDESLWQGLARIEQQISNQERYERLAAELTKLVSAAEGPGPDWQVILTRLEDLIQNAHDIELTPVQREWTKWIETVGMLNRGLERRNPDELSTLIQTCKKVEFTELPPTYVQLIRSLIVEAEKIVADHETAPPHSPSQSHTPKTEKPKLFRLSLFPGSFRSADFDFELQGSKRKRESNISSHRSTSIETVDLSVSCGQSGGVLKPAISVPHSNQTIEIVCEDTGPRIRSF